MKLRQYQIDAFATRIFEGNPAAVVPLDAWLPDALMQSIARENNLSETAFIVRTGAGFDLRWFTPNVEVDLCGHATLASAFVVFEELRYQNTTVRFQTRSGELSVSRRGDLLVMDFPALLSQPVPEIAALVRALGHAPREVRAAKHYLAVFDDEATIRALRPDMAAVASLALQGVCCTAPGRDVDFVSRFFAPKVGVPEDPVTGSAHCEMAPYWAERTGKSAFHARQLSSRGGDVWCELKGNRVELAGRAVKFMDAEIYV